MIIVCINCNKKFDVNSDLIPDEGRTIQCGSCNHVWFFNKNSLNEKAYTDLEIEKSPPVIKERKSIKPEQTINKSNKNKQIQNLNEKNFEIVKYQSNFKFSFSKFLSYIVIFIISLVALIIILDTFKLQLYNLFPDLEFFLFSLYETLKDVGLFLKDLIK